MGRVFLYLTRTYLVRGLVCGCGWMGGWCGVSVMVESGCFVLLIGCDGQPVAIGWVSFPFRIWYLHWVNIRRNENRSKLFPLSLFRQPPTLPPHTTHTHTYTPNKSLPNTKQPDQNSYYKWPPSGFPKRRGQLIYLETNKCWFTK